MKIPGNWIHWSFIYLLSEWVIRLVMLFYVPQRRGPAAARSWILLILVLPWPGLLLFLLFGRIYLSQHRIDRQQRASRSIRAAQKQVGQRTTALPLLPPVLTPLVNLAARLGDFEPYGGNGVEVLTDYAGSIDRLVEDINSARHHAHLLYYIYGDDKVGRRVGAALAQAVRRGVECRVLMDAVASKKALARLAPEMRKNGIEVKALMPVRFFHKDTGRLDLRNHRKIAVFDGRIGYVGSQNVVGPEFVPGFPNEELVVRLTGPGVVQLQAVFLADHYFETGGTLEKPELLPNPGDAGNSILQVVPSGPGYQRENGQELIVALLYAARERVVITTPYFVPDEPFLQAIRSAARRGVSVHLVLSEHANQLITQLAQRSYYTELLAAGVRIHLYKPRFLHAKHLTIDDEIVLVGSTNIDIRSFALNAEINVLIYDRAVLAHFRKIQEAYFEHSHQLTEKEWMECPFWSRSIQGIARLADSFL